MLPSGSSVSGTPFLLKPWKRDQCGDQTEHESALPVTGNQLVFENEASKFLDRRVIKFMLEIVEKYSSVLLGMEVYKAF